MVCMIAYTGLAMSLISVAYMVVERLFDICPCLDVWMDKFLGVNDESECEE